MKIFVVTVVQVFLFMQTAFAQYGNANLLVQSPDGKTVKLIWFIKKWSPEITGFDIKRKDGFQDWVKLNKAPILPEISTKKDLSIVESDRTELSRIKNKLYDLVSNNVLQQTDNETYLKKLNSDDNAVREVANMVAHDYDLALLNGFAFVDHTVTKKMDYQYGLFIQGTDVLLDSVKWDYGQIPDLNVVSFVTSRSTTATKGIEILWDADLTKMKEGDVAGFNIYREGIRLNSRPIIPENDKEPASFSWYDKNANSAHAYQYSISAQSIFDIEGIIRPYIYNPADHPHEYKKTAVTEVASLGYYFKEGIAVKWTFPTEYERFIKGFYIEKDNMPEGYKQVSVLLKPSDRSYTDTSASQVSGFIRFSVVAVYNDKTRTPGIPRIYSYFPSRQSPSPQNCKANAIKKGKKFIVNITWDPAMPGDDATNYYIVYVSDPADNTLKPVTNKQIHTNAYSDTIDHGSAYNYTFYVTSMSKNNIESLPGDTLTVNIPTIDLPQPSVSEVFADNGRAVIHWNYPQVSDLKGFRVYQGQEPITTEKDLGKNVREFITSALREDSTYNFTIQAVARNGVISSLSAPATLTIPRKSKK